MSILISSLLQNTTDHGICIVLLEIEHDFIYKSKEECRIRIDLYQQDEGHCCHDVWETSHLMSTVVMMHGNQSSVPVIKMDSSEGNTHYIYSCRDIDIVELFS